MTQQPTRHLALILMGLVVIVLLSMLKYINTMLLKELGHHIK